MGVDATSGLEVVRSGKLIWHAVLAQGHVELKDWHNPDITEVWCGYYS